MKITKIIVLLSLVVLAACQNTSVSDSAQDLANESNEANCSSAVNPESWPLQRPVFARDPAIEAQVSKLVSQMTLEEKVGQVLQADIDFITPEEVKKYHIGSILNGGNSAPNKDNRSPPEAWLELADAFWSASVDTSDGGQRIPLIWGTDAVHGHNNIVGATIFPHNIGLGAANDSDLIRRIAGVTAREIRVTGMDWTFAPTVAVVRNDRWGRTYESYSEAPDIVARFSQAYVTGVQGALNSERFLDDVHLLATVKHFVGDGGTKDGIDQGDTQVSEAELRDIHAAGYPSAIRAGALVAMASFNSWCGKKLHGYKPILTDVLRDRMGFDGFVVGDWNGHAQVKGCSRTSCAQAINAGLDMYMASDSWKGMYYSLLEQVKSGEVSLSRLEEAVTRILRVKFLAGVMTNKKPSERKYGGDVALLGAPEHRAVAREAVRKSLVLLKNNRSLLPLVPQQRVLVAGAAADDIGMQSGGWTLSWQGDGNNNSHFPNGQSILGGIVEAVSKAGGSAEYSADGSFTTKPDVAIVVFGERPYAEFQGDIPNLDFRSKDGLNLLKKFKENNIPTVAVFLSGRPMWVNPEINAADAFVAAWLPGSEGGGVADLLFRRADGRVNYDFSGRLSFSWPSSAADVELNVGDDDYAPLFAYGYGLSVYSVADIAELSEEPGVDVADPSRIRLVASGDAMSPWRLMLRDEDGGMNPATGPRTSSPGGNIVHTPADDQAQEDTSILTWHGKASAFLWSGDIEADAPLDNYVLQTRYRVLGEKVAQTHLLLVCGEDCQGELDVTANLEQQVGQGWQIVETPLSCFNLGDMALSGLLSPFVLSSDAGTQIQLSEVNLLKSPAPLSCAGN